MTQTPLRLLLAQCDLTVGDIDGNAARVLGAASAAHAAGADLVMLPELALAGYPPEDLLFHSGFRRQVRAAVDRLCREAGPVDVLFGYPEYAGRAIYNSAGLIRGGRVHANHHKEVLPNYKVFDEKRYFTAGQTPTLVDVKGGRVALLVCEDIWEPEPAMQARAAGAEALLVINASPYQLHKQREREQVARARVTTVGLPLVYLNLVGGQDELVFDGNSFVLAADGTVTQRLPAWREATAIVELARIDGRLAPLPGAIAPELGEEASVYEALVYGVRDYVTKHGFPGVVMGLSGGVDSALTLAIAVDALGPQRVHAVMMPSRYTAQISREDAEAEARALGVRYSTISIEGMFEATLAALAGEFAGRAPDTAEENIQSRCRGVLLMGISNKTGAMLLTTGNKSETAVGYATLYGDMAGGFAPIKDCSKLLVYRLAKYRNGISAVIPARVITRPPSAELRAGQKDTDSLPPYEVMDPILEAFIEEDLSVDEIAARGFDRATVGRILEMVKRNEYKRRQAPPGIRISGRAFGRDWRYPITSGYRTR
ncbi:MAG TPA: NAD+ synthase [Steroidobacteraceae bacterium]|nr:NAD+ synthase [Steroidobacteraceae bacterium]